MPKQPADRVLLEASARLHRAHRDPARPVRLLGVGVQNLQPFAQLNLLQAGDGRAGRGAAGRSGDLDRRLDALRARYGPQAVTRGPAEPIAQRDVRREDLDAVLTQTPDTGMGSA